MKRNLIKDPTLTVLLLYVIAWLVGNGLLLYVVTDGFIESPFDGKNLMLGVLFIFSSAATIKVMRNYFQSKKAGL
ncbi:hypothetical protein [Pontibacter populi]|uniref:CPBP family intramembrane metalloprotease n=1 Tax=Pontibacter populi TaxID=890055 RepID=A0ABV1RVE2_9BACT